jgi:putative exporter of polyketide antibiotics
MMWLVWLIVALVVVALIGIAVILRRRRAGGIVAVHRGKRR